MPRPPILVVEDDASIRSMVVELLSLEGYPVAAVASGIEALAIVERQRPVLILLDLRLPGMNGWEFTDHLRRRGVHTPILVMTAAHSVKVWAEEVAADGYVAKPFSVDDLLAEIERLLASSHQPAA